jgi:hypothetical protein
MKRLTAKNFQDLVVWLNSGFWLLNTLGKTINNDNMRQIVRDELSE